MRAADLHLRLEELYAKYHRAEFLGTDPLQLAHRYADPADREVMALIAAAFASGNIKAILAVLESVASAMGPRPAEWLRSNSPVQLRGALAGVRHRWVRESDAEIFLALIGAALRRHGSLGALWQSVDDPAEPTTQPALARFVAAILAEDVAPLVSRRREVRRADGSVSDLAPVESILLTSPDGGSACKRMNLFLRWVARPADGVDLGLWTSFLSPARLVMPVDVHVMRACRAWRLTTRRQPDLKAALEITAKLRKLCPEDPCRYDFSMVREGIGIGE